MSSPSLLLSLSYRIRSVFYLCDVGLCNSDLKFQTSIASFVCDRIANVGIRILSWNKRNILVPKLFDFADLYSLMYL